MCNQSAGPPQESGPRETAAGVGQRESEVLSRMWQKLGHTNQTQPSNKLRQSKVGSEEIRLKTHFLDSSKSTCCCS